MKIKDLLVYQGKLALWDIDNIRRAFQENTHIRHKKVCQRIWSLRMCSTLSHQKVT